MPHSFNRSTRGAGGSVPSAAELHARINRMVALYEARQAVLDAKCIAPASRFSAAVIGGGLAGLSAALSLARRGMQVTLFEARPGVGGRVASTERFSHGHIIEYGAELVGANHPTWQALARRYHLSLIGRGDQALMSKAGLQPRLRLGGAFVSEKELNLLDETLLNKVFVPLGERAKKIQHPDAPWKQPGLKDWDTLSVAAALKNWCGLTPGSKPWQLMELMLVNNNVAPLDTLNLLGLLCLIKAGQFKASAGDDHDPKLLGYWDVLEIFRCAEGCGTLAQRMKNEFVRDLKGQIHLQAAVTDIDLSARPRLLWRAVDEKGNAAIGAARDLAVDYVVLAVPPSVWSGIRVTPQKYDPATAVGLMRMGPAVKFFSELDRRFWIDAGHAPLGGAMEVGQVWEGTDNQMLLVEQRPVLNVFAGGRIPSQGDMEKGLNDILPGYDTHVNKSNRRLVNWPTEPFIKTGYSSPGLGQIFSVGKKLNEPLAGRLCFAGEHTSMGHFGYMEGALQSGERAAQQILALACKAEPTTPAPSRPSPTPARPGDLRVAELAAAVEHQVAAKVPVPAELLHAAEKIDAGLGTADKVLPLLVDTPTRNLLRLIVSQLQADFFPRGHGLIDAKGKVIRTSRRGRIDTQLERADGSRWPFEHRVLLWLSARPPGNATLAGQHATGATSSLVTIFTKDIGTVSSTSAAGVAVHEFVHMLLSMVQHMRQAYGDTATRRFLSSEPWQRLDARMFKPQQRALAAMLEPLRKLLPMQVSADELAESLVGEAMAYTLAQWLSSAVDAVTASRSRDPKITATASITPLLVRHYIVERSPQFAASLKSAAVTAAVARIEPAIDALLDALRDHWGPVVINSKTATRPGTGLHGPVQAVAGHEPGGWYAYLSGRASTGRPSR